MGSTGFLSVLGGSGGCLKVSALVYLYLGVSIRCLQRNAFSVFTRKCWRLQHRGRPLDGSNRPLLTV